MKVLLAVHGYPPELRGGTEHAVQGLARALAAAGHAVCVFAGSLDWEGGFRTTRTLDADPESGKSFGVVRVHRDDLYFDHWQKSAHPAVGAVFEELLREFEPDVFHVHHWIRLTDDLVARAARLGVPGCVSLHDLWTTCLVTFRVRPDTGAVCDAPLAPSPCLDCAAHWPPRTPWRDRMELSVAVAKRRETLAAELRGARAVLAPSAAHAANVLDLLGLERGSVRVRAVAPGRQLALAPRAPLAPPRELGRVVLGAWGELHPLKGVDLLIDALGLVPEPQRFTLHLAGGEVRPGYADELRERARGLDLVLHGRFDLDELADHAVTEVHAMVSGTRARESWGLVLDEALALRLPMVLPDTPAFLEHLSVADRGEPRGALWFAARDAEALAAQLWRLWAEPELVAGLRAELPELADVAPSPARHAAELAEIYAECIAAGAPEVPAADWFEDRLARFELERWDAAFRDADPGELGLG